MPVKAVAKFLKKRGVVNNNSVLRSRSKAAWSRIFISGAGAKPHGAVFLLAEPEQSRMEPYIYLWSRSRYWLWIFGLPQV
jgi:hypothetical protein